MKILITGGTGLVGTHLSGTLASKGHEVTILTRSVSLPARAVPRIHYVSADPTQPGPWQKSAADHDAVINLAGQSIFGRWNDEKKKRIWESRILTTRGVVEALQQKRDKPGVLLSTSGVGYYGPCGEEEIDESHPSGRDFLALLSREWESEAKRAQETGARVVLCRFGVVLSSTGGALKQMIPAFRAGLGSPLGSGRQWFPWIHVQDLVSALSFVLGKDDLEGPLNCVSPQPVRNREFTRALAKALGRPHALPAVPGFMLKFAMGEFSAVLLTGQKAVPRRLLDAGFRFDHPSIEEALRNLFGKPSN